MLLETCIWFCKFRELFNFICKRILLSLTKATQIFDIKSEQVSVCSGHGFPHDPSNTADQLFHTEQDIQSQKKPKCKQTIHSFVLISSMSQKQEVAIVFFRTKTRMVLSPGQGVGQPHSTQPRVMEDSARGSVQTQSRAAAATEGMDGSLLRDPGCSGAHPGGPQCLLGGPGHSLFCTSPFSATKGIRKSVLSSNTLLQTWAHGISSAGEEGGDIRGVALPAVMSWARTISGGRCFQGLMSWYCDTPLFLHASPLSSSKSHIHMLKTVVDNPKVLLHVFWTFLFAL